MIAKAVSKRIKKQSKEKTIGNWLCLFPKKSQAEVDNLLKQISGKTLEDYYDGYETENDVMADIESVFSDSEEGYGDYLDRLSDEIYKENTWAYFYEPIIYRHREIIDRIRDLKDILVDPDELIQSVIKDIAYKLSDKSYRILVDAFNSEMEAHKCESAESFYTGKLRDTEYVKNIYLSYPELFESLDKTVEYSLDYTSEIIVNTAKNIDQLAEHFWKSEKPGRIRYLQSGSGDTHNNGRSVAAIIFENGQKLMYKPHSLKMEEGFGKLVDWLAEKTGGMIELGKCDVYVDGNAGWTEFIENRECSSKKEVREFYRKMGELLCIIYTFSGKDFHCENVIASGKYPILIDLETLIHVEGMEKTDGHEVIEETITDYIGKSVYTTALLPSVIHNFNTDQSMEVGGLCSGRKRISPFKAKVMKRSEGDRLEINGENMEVPLNQNLPVYKGEKVGAVGYFKDVKEGFVETYSWILENREEYISMIRRFFRGVECRVIYKTTNNYTQLLNTSYHPSLLHSRTDREIYFHRIGLLYNEKTDMSALYRDEIKSMMNGDVPAYIMRSDEENVRNMQDECVYRGHTGTPLDDIEVKIRTMSANDMERQMSLIYMCFDGCMIPTDVEEKSEMKRLSPDSGYNRMSYRDSEKTRILQEAKKIAEKTISRSFSDKINGKRHLSWMGFQGLGDFGYAITPVGWDMYKGNCGIALYYFRLAEVTHDTIYSDYAKDILNSVENTFRTASDTDLRNVGIGAFTGYTGYIYMICKIREHKWFTKQELGLRTPYVCRMIDYMMNADLSEERIDLLSGLAGALGVMVTLYEYIDRYNWKGLVDRKDDIILIMRRISDEIMGRLGVKNTWFENGDIGFVHGNAGIIAQLARANRYLKDEQIIEAIERVLDYENTERFDQEKKLWKLRDGVHYLSWCNGIGGMILSKIILIEAGYRTELLENGLKRMVSQLAETGFGVTPCLCHGDMGSLIILKYAAAYLKDKTLITRCMNSAADYLDKNVDGKNISVREDWGLMTGITGMGFGLLELMENSDCLASIISLT